MKELLKIKNIEDLEKASKLIKDVIRAELIETEKMFSTTLFLLMDGNVDLSIKYCDFEEKSYVLVVDFKIGTFGLNSYEDCPDEDKASYEKFSKNILSNIAVGIEKCIATTFILGDKSHLRDGVKRISIHLELK